MANLRVNKIAAPIVKDEFTGSVYFDGVNDGLIIQDNDDFNFGSGDFCMEMFIYPKSYSPSGYSYFMGQYGTSYTTFWSMASEKNDCFFYYGGSNIRISGTYTIPLNAWTHVAVTKEGNTIRLFTNGSLDASGTFTHTLNDASVNFTIGKDSADAYDFDGYVSNARVCKGHAVYTENFTVPTRELPVHTAPPKGVVFPAADNRTVLLACQSSTDATAEATGRHIITVDGDATAADANPGLIRKTNITSTITENTGSVYFDGTGDYLDIVENNNDFDFDGDFTVEFWVYFNTVNQRNDTVGSGNNSVYLGSSKSGWIASYYTLSGSKWHFSYQSNQSWIFEYTFSFTSVADTWYHVAFTRESSSIKCFVDGVQQGSTQSSSATLTSSENLLRVGGGGGSTSLLLNGYLSNLRVCKGHAVYTSNFTPPTRELEVHEGPEDDRTVLLACYDGENIFADKTGRHIIAAYGDRLSSPTPTATDSPIGITTFNPGLTRSVDATAGPTFQGGAGFVSQNWLTLPKGTTTDRNLCGTRGLFAGSNPQPGDTGGNTIEFITVSTTGNTQDFGDRIGKGRRAIAAMSGSTRAVFAGSYGPSSTIADTIDYVNIATTGNAVDFGNCLSDLTEATGISNSTRGIIAGGRTPTVSNVMQYVTIPTLGNAIDFGDLSVAKRNAGSFQSSTRGVVAGGRNPSGTELNVIEYVTIASTGNAVDFGDISSGGGQNNMGGSNSTRGLVAGGSPSTNTITYVTISTLGNSVDFGDNTAATHGMNTMATSPTRACMFGAANPARTLSYVEIATTGNALDFGSFGIDATTAYSSGCSNSHGGIS